MIHVVLFKFKNKEVLGNTSEVLEKIYEGLKHEYKVIEDYKYSLNCMDNLDANMHLILKVYLENEDSLSGYINHPTHVDFVNTLKESGLIEKAAIDIK